MKRFPHVVDGVGDVVGFAVADSGDRAARPAAAAEVDEEGVVAGLVDDLRLAEDGRLAAGVAREQQADAAAPPPGRAVGGDVPGFVLGAVGAAVAVGVVGQVERRRRHRVDRPGQVDAGEQHADFRHPAELVRPRRAGAAGDEVRHRIGVHERERVEQQEHEQHERDEGRPGPAADPGESAGAARPKRAPSSRRTVCAPGDSVSFEIASGSDCMGDKA